MIPTRYSFPIIVALALLILAWGAFGTFRMYQTACALPASQTSEPGKAYEDLKPYLYGLESISYFTDRELRPESPQMKYFLSAQYMLAPVLLDVDNPDHELMLIDGQSFVYPFDIMQALNAEMIYINNAGKILARVNP